MEYRPPGEAWDERYFFRTTPRALVHFEATCEFLATDPESPFVSDPVLTRSTGDGCVKLTPERFTRWSRGKPSEREVGADKWAALREREFGIEY